MGRRTLCARLDSCWVALCLEFVRRAPWAPDRSVRLLNFLARVAGLPRPCPVLKG